MSAHMRKHHTESNDVIHMHHAGVFYQFPLHVAKKYRVTGKKIDAEYIFSDLNKKYTRPGALLRGIRVRDNLTQIEMAKLIKVTQSDISQMENGKRGIGRTIAKRIAKLFGVDYRSFL